MFIVGRIVLVAVHSNGSVDRATMSNQLYREGQSQKFWDQTILLTASEDLSGPERETKELNMMAVEIR